MEDAAIELFVWLVLGYFQSLLALPPLEIAYVVASGVFGWFMGRFLGNI